MSTGVVIVGASPSMTIPECNRAVPETDRHLTLCGDRRASGAPRRSVPQAVPLTDQPPRRQAISFERLA